MKYFIDFEATQFTNEIISIGCIDENGKTFYSLVNVPKKKMSKFIVNLTNITKEEASAAPSNDEVFSDFYDWLEENKSFAKFYCYGNSDLNFIKKNLKKARNIKAQAALSLLAENLHDYSLDVIHHFGLVKAIGLKKVVAYYRNVETIEQNHNALEDAEFLKEVYDYINEEDDIVACPFEGYDVADNPKVILEIDDNNRVTNINYNAIMSNLNKYKVYECRGKKLKTANEEYENVKVAAANIIEKKDSEKQANKPVMENIIRRILKSNNKQQTYNERYWIVVKKGTDE